MLFSAAQCRASLATSISPKYSGIALRKAPRTGRNTDTNSFPASHQELTDGSKHLRTKIGGVVSIMKVSHAKRF